MTKSKLEVFDVTIIGAGPTGLFGAFYAGLRELKVKLTDALPQAGGQLIALYPEKLIYDTPGFPEVLSKRLHGDAEPNPLLAADDDLVDASEQGAHQVAFGGG